MSSVKSRRLRKKLYLDEFAVKGVEVDCTLTCKDEPELAVIMDDFLLYVDSLNLFVSGGGDLTTLSGFISSNERYGSVTEAQRASISAWLKEQKLVAEFTVGELVDANYGE
ncbi:50S ribosome-binding protein YggL [Colwellia sp. E2M01]|uniref:50S ribosome-binding protein YggL n=1 Tax=Colwellia sp. E2M01 TaxID=2841561 RepID=UPI001C0A5C79|nr:50S ribosome-binding protein YggL [Colwellia sp. E2M01]MBU2869316.1 YggL family protein [Colwellia sp. E2M01]